MPVDIEHCIRLRRSLPHDIICKHRRICVSRVLSPAAVFLRASGLTHLLRERRRIEIQVVDGTTAIRLTPQRARLLWPSTSENLRGGRRVLEGHYGTNSSTNAMPFDF